MDHDAACAAELRQRLLSHPAEKMLLRIVVRELESWLLADAENFSRFLKVPKLNFPEHPELLDDPKGEVIRLAKKSRSRHIRDDMVPRPESGAKEGPAYAAQLADFADNHWRPDIASNSCDSLRRCLMRMREWAKHV